MKRFKQAAAVTVISTLMAVTASAEQCVGSCDPSIMSCVGDSTAGNVTIIEWSAGTVIVAVGGVLAWIAYNMGISE